MKLHQGEAAKKHKCKSCGKGFISGSGLTRHLKTHAIAEADIYSCPICGKQFGRIDNLKTHCKGVHRDVVSKVVKSRIELCHA